MILEVLEDWTPHLERYLQALCIWAKNKRTSQSPCSPSTDGKRQAIAHKVLPWVWRGLVIWGRHNAGIGRAMQTSSHEQQRNLFHREHMYLRTCSPSTQETVWKFWTSFVCHPFASLVNSHSTSNFYFKQPKITNSRCCVESLKRNLIFWLYTKMH